MPLQKHPLTPVDAFLDVDAREQRQAAEERCGQSRREWERKNALLWALLGALVVAALLLAWKLLAGTR